MIVNEQKPIKLLNTCNAIYDDKLVIKGILDFASEPVAQTKKVFMMGNYPGVAIRQHKLHIHRVIWFAANGAIPLGKYVHHINHNKLDARLENLMLLDKSEHQSYHNKGRKQSPEHVAKRVNSTAKTKYERSIYENPELLKENQNVEV